MAFVPPGLCPWRRARGLILDIVQAVATSLAKASSKLTESIDERRLPDFVRELEAFADMKPSPAKSYMRAQGSCALQAEVKGRRTTRSDGRDEGHIAVVSVDTADQSPGELSCSETVPTHGRREP
jgi:hypothetical protein